jgi:hypothetical protein
VNSNPLAGSDAEAGWVRLASPRTLQLLGLAIALLTVGAVPLTVLSAANSAGLIVTPFAVVGALVASRQTRNPIGWILLVLSLAFLLSSDAGQYAVMAYHQGYGGLPVPRAAAFLAAMWIWLIVLLPLPLMLFPDGHLSRRWQWVLRMYGAGCAVFIAGATWRDATGILARHIRVDSSGELVSVGNSAAPGPILGAFAVLYVAFCLASVARQLVSYRGSRGEHRQQLKWLLSGGAISVLGLVLTLALSNVHSRFLHDVGNKSFIGLIALPIGMGVGILKYRLYEIDRLISRTLSYLILSGVLVGVFVGSVALTTRVLPFSSPVGVAASTLAAAALFNPLRRRAQRLVDRRFNRARYDAEATLSAFTARLQDAVDLVTVHDELLRTVDRAVEPSGASLWIRPPNPGARA